MSTSQMDAAMAVTRRLSAAGHRAVINGGAVRDHLLGVTPNDVDVATSARPEEVAELFPDSRLVGAAFGVVLVNVGGQSIEVATFRSEGPYLDGRRPSEVRFATEEEDVQRRDFTVNGMLLDPATGEVIDHVGGHADLDAKVLRAIGDPRDRFEEDHLRLLRAVRFAAQLDFEIEEKTRAAVSELAPLARKVAAERTRDELIRLLTGPDPERGLRLLHETGLLHEILPEVAAMDGVEQPPQFHPEGDVLTHTILLFRHLQAPSTELAFGALLHDVGKPPTFQVADRIRFPEHCRVGADMTDRICRDLRLSNDSREQVVALVANHMKFKDVQKMRTSTLKRFLGMPRFEEHLALHRADCLASHGLLDNWEFARDRLEELGEEQIHPPPLVTGGDLMELGWTEGPELGRELRAIEELQLEGAIRTKDQALARAREDLPKQD
jgi:poly(A) polymerase